MGRETEDTLEKDGRSVRHARFERLFDENFRAVLAYALRRTAPTEADDVVAETFVIAWRRLDDVPKDARPWLLGVARRVLANERRAAGRRAALIQQVAQELRRESDVRDRPPILRALAGLSASDRELLVLCAWDGLSTDEAAAALGCSRTALKVRMHRARRRLRAELQRVERSELPHAPTPPRLEECHEE